MTMPTAATANAGWKPNRALHELGDDRRQERADVDAHVEDVVGAVLEVAALGIEVADHRRDVRLEEAVADDQAGQRRVDDRRASGPTSSRWPAMKKKPPIITARR